MKNLRSFVIAVSISLLHIAAYAQEESPYGPVSGSMGRAGVAANDSGEQIFTNPAAMVHGDALVSGYFYQSGETEEGEEQDWFAITIQDNSEDVFITGGVYYSQASYEFRNLANFEERRFQASVASFVIQHLSWGASIYRVNREVLNDKEYEFYDGEFSLLWNPAPHFAMGLKYENLARHGSDVPEHIKLRDRLTLGMNKLLIAQVRARFDLSQQMENNPNHRADLRTGLESYMGDFFVLRLGFERQQLADRKYYSAGLGFAGPVLRIDYSYRKNADFSGGALHSVDFRLPF